ncbi:styrene monooxygenase/indole monooxygenase family protein, partial [Nocardiopsis sp. JB363]|uniref:styrene monooxygenase/indole monooxygenase family protein n=1 Tax=Nocardiopsis sp. JB363 TaxID=1434837 RepID=UPI000B358D0F
MSRNIMIVGASASGLQLAHQLLTDGYRVTLITGHSSTEIRSSHLPLFSFTLAGARAHERELELAMWEARAPRIQGVELQLHPPHGDPATVLGAFQAPGTSVDRRVQMADWLEYFEDRGGKAVIHGVTVTDLDYFSRMFDLIVVAVGDGELGQLFDRAQNGAPTRDRVVAQVLLEEVHDSGHGRLGGDVASVGSTQEMRAILAPVLTKEGPGHILQLVSSTGGPTDAWPDRPGPQEQLRRSQDLLRRYFPVLAERVQHAELLGERSTSVHRISPHARHPVGVLPSGGHVLGMGNGLVRTDPMAAQGGNVSSHGAQHYRARILAHGDAAFDPAWMQDTFDGFWGGLPFKHGPHAGMGQAAAGLSEMLDAMWEPHAPAHVGQVFDAATTHPEIAERIVAGLVDPRTYADWLLDPE